MSFCVTKGQSLRSALLLGAASAAAFGFAAPASAQEQVETVVVTGSRIPQTGLYSSSPVTAVGQQEVKLSGTTSVESLINNLPAAFADFTDTASNGATGTATVDLRGLGNVRTLVLVNGRRLMPSDPALPVADLNQIPASLVDHVEVLTGGASAVYGSDALAGVVNFIMRKDFEGVEVDGQYSVNNAPNDDNALRQYQDNAGVAHAPKDTWDGETADASIILGANTADGKGNITAYLTYRDIQPITQSQRDYSACSLTTTFAAPPFNSVSNPPFYCLGSSNFDRIKSIDNGANYFVNGTGSAGKGFLSPYVGGSAQTYNFAPLNYIQRPDTRYTGGYFAHYQINPAVDVYSDFMFSDDHTLAQIAESGLFGGTGVASPGNTSTSLNPGDVQINCANPLMTSQENKVLCGTTAGNSVVTDAFGHSYYGGQGNINPGFALTQVSRRDLEGGPRINDLRHTAYRMDIGARGDLGNGWSYDVYGQYGLTLFSENFQNEFSVQRSANALNVVNTAAGPQCVAKITGTDSKCVPLDIFDGFGGISPQALGYVLAQGFQSGYTQEQVLSGSLTGDLGQYGIQFPWAKSGVGIALGAEYRDEALKRDVSRDFSTGDLYGQGGATLPIPYSSFNVVEGFGEVRVPVVQGQPFFEDLTLNAGYRYSSYSTVGFVASYKYGAEWQPIDDFRIRASFQRAVRAPNVLEAFAPANIVLFGGQDPCAGSKAGNCASVPNAGTGFNTCPASQCNTQVSGNANLKPETSDTRSIGIVLTPTFLPGFSATIDYFDIKVADYISVVNPNIALSGCYGTTNAAANAYFCPLIHRDSTGAVYGAGFVAAHNTNLPFLKTTGVDFEANYQADLDDWGMNGYGGLSFNFVGTYLESLETKPVPVNTGGDATYDCSGLYGVVCGNPAPKWRHKLRVTWSTPWDVDFSVNWRHLSSVGLDENTSNTNLNGLLTSYCAAYGICNGDAPDAKIKTFDYFDLAASWTVREGLELRAGVDNVFAKEPPVVDSNNIAASAPPFGNGNTFPGVYDALGRTIFVGATLKY